MLKTFILLNLNSGEVATQTTTERMFLNPTYTTGNWHIWGEYDATETKAIDAAIKSVKDCSHLKGI